jgi:hypothetical protein
LQLVQLVDDQHARLLDPLQGPHQPLDKHVALRPGRLAEPGRRRMAVGDHSKRVDHGCPEPPPVTLLARDGRPRRTPSHARRRDPGAQQRGLPAPGRRGHDRHAAGSGEPLEQPAPEDQRFVAAARGPADGIGRMRVTKQRHDLGAAAGDRRAGCGAADRTEMWINCKVAFGEQAVHPFVCRGKRTQRRSHDAWPADIPLRPTTATCPLDNRMSGMPDAASRARPNHGGAACLRKGAPARV